MTSPAAASAPDSDRRAPRARLLLATRPHQAGVVGGAATKAETLAALHTALISSDHRRPSRSRSPRIRIPPFVWFTVRDWETRRRDVLAMIASRLACRALAVRSSTRAEDGADCSHAGRYRTRLDVPNRPDALAAAIDEVRSSYDGNPDDQVLVQEMERRTAMSGVVFSHDPETGAPYRIVEYDDRSFRTDRVTRGTATPSIAVVHHDVAPARVRDLRVRRVLGVTRAVEKALGNGAVEIEFALRADGAVALLQARPLTRARPRAATASRLAKGLARLARIVTVRNRPHPTLAGRRTSLGQMPDWNPAELLGALPRPLSTSLFRRLVSDDVWQRARASMGYRPVPGQPLMVVLAGRPYVDVRVSFNSFLPDGLRDHTARSLVEAWMGRLHDHPELHDKVELDVVQSSVDFAFATAHRARYGAALRSEEFSRWARALGAVTAAAVTCAPRGSLARALAASARLAAQENGATPSQRAGALVPAFRLLARCARAGTLPFAIVARHAFIAEALLRSAVERGALSSERLVAFRRSLRTVAGEVAADFAAACDGGSTAAAFLARYGHLRPGTFDVTSLRYDQRRDLWRSTPDGRPQAPPRPEPFVAQAKELRALEQLIAEAGLACSAGELLRYAAAAITGRERTKLAFSRCVSDALECLAAWAARQGLSRDDLSYLRLDDLDPVGRPGRTPTSAQLRDLIEARRTRAAALRALRLPPLIRGPRDLYVWPPCAALPTFVTSRNVTAPAVDVDGRAHQTPAVSGRIVCIESADPGFDWIFAYRVAGLVTRFGGGNSHMAIRCLELAIPAAIGVGEAVFGRVSHAGSIELRCGERLVRPVDPPRGPS